MLYVTILIFFKVPPVPLVQLEQLDPQDLKVQLVSLAAQVQLVRQEQLVTLDLPVPLDLPEAQAQLATPVPLDQQATPDPQDPSVPPEEPEVLDLLVTPEVLVHKE